jgi:TetR/AcrR family transcriptional regulator, regulator of autoinduction and epiphytic fitness
MDGSSDGNMDEPVKSAVGRRQRKALATRQRVLEAAETLFVRDGYTTTTMTGIAEEADVAVQTVYAVFGTKRAIVAELLAVRLVGDDEGTPLRDRRDWHDLEREADPGRQLALLASIVTRIGNRVAAFGAVRAAAAGADPEIAEMYRRQQQSRYRDQRRVPRSVSRKGPCEPGCPRPAPPASSGPSPTPTPVAASSANGGGGPRSTSAGWPTCWPAPS